MKKTYLARANPNGGLDMTDHQRLDLKDFIKKNAGKRLRMVIDQMTPESGKQRGFYHGGVLSLWAYLDGHDYRSSEILDYYHEVGKREFNSDIIIIAGKSEKVGKSTKGELNDGYLNRLIDFLEEQYGIDRTKVLNPETYKHFRDKIYGFGKYDTFIEYMEDLGLIHR